MNRAARSLGLFCAFTCLLPVWSAPAAPPSTQPASQHAAPKVLAEFDVAKDGESVIVPVRLDGREYPFLLDTAASLTVFDTSLRSKLGPVRKTVQAATASGKVRRLELFDPPTASWGPVKLENAGPVACVDLKLFRHILGRDLRGVLGFAAMKRHVVQIDFDGGKLRLMAPVGRVRRPEWGVALNIDTGRYGLPRAALAVGKRQGLSCLLDTGMQGAGEMPPVLFNDCVKQFNLKTAERLAAGAGSVFKHRSARIPEVRIGPLRYKGLIFDESPRLAVGLGVLSRHLVTFDFPNGRLYLKPGRHFNRTDEIEMSGLALVRRPAGTVAFAVRGGSPAKQAGVKPKDLILTVNGKPAGNYTMGELKKLMRSSHGRKITMAIRRGAQDLGVEFFLAKRI